MSLKLYIKPHQLKNKNNENVVVQCNGGMAEYILGDVPSTWADITDDVEGLEELQILITTNDSSKKSKEKGATFEIAVTGAARELIYSWMFTNPCDYLNYFDARIEDTTCTITFNEFQIKPDNIEYCDDDGCVFTLPLRESDDKYNTLRKLSIHDNWQKWFSEDGIKTHPTFQVIRQPAEYSFAGVRVGLILFVKSVPAVGLLLNSLFDFDKTLKRMLGFGYYCPAPRIYDILLNAAQRAGLQLDTPFNPSGLLHNDCLFLPYGGHYYTDFNEGDRPSPSTVHIWMNRFIWQMTEFLDELCKLYNLEWDVVGSTLVMRQYQDVIVSAPVAEFLEPENVCYSVDLSKKPSYGRYQYTSDPQDAASNEVLPLYNDIVDFDGITDNPLLEGEARKDFRFSSTAFLHDHIGEDYVDSVTDDARITAYILTGIIAIVTAALIGGALTLIAAGILAAATAAALVLINNYTQNLKGDYGEGTTFKGIVRVMGSGEVSAPRILRYNPASPLANARAVAVPIGSILPNVYYNTTSIPYASQNFGIGVYGTMQFVYNYPLFFDAMYTGNLYDTFHEQTDNPMVVNIGNKTVSFQLGLCCDVLSSIGIASGAQTIVGKVIKIKQDTYLLVKELNVNYSTRVVSIKGKILLR